MGVVVKIEVWVWWWRIFKYFPYIDEHAEIDGMQEAMANVLKSEGL